MLAALNAAAEDPPSGIAKGMTGERWMYLGDRRVPISAAKKPVKRSLNAEHLKRQRDLIVALAKLPDMIELFCETLMPHHICAYLYDLAGKISAFTRDCRVLGSENEDARLVLCEASAVTMRTCLNMLGIEAPMRL